MYRWVEHTGELELAIEAGSEEEVFRDALAAFHELVSNGAGGEGERREIVLAGPDLASLLVDFLAELVFLAETEDFVPERVEGLDVAPDAVHATVTGGAGRPPHLVKAVTYHRLEFARAHGLWRARVVLDV